MSCKMCNTPKSRCPAFDGEFEKCWLGFPIKVKTTERFEQMNFRYYTPACRCTKPKSIKEFVDMDLHQSRTRGVAI